MTSSHKKTKETAIQSLLDFAVQKLDAGKADKITVLDLKGKLVSPKDDSKETVDQNLQDAHDALLALGYREQEIKSVLREVAKSDYKNTDEAMRIALSYLLKRY